jgi:tetratricopeptide (TPR) repeat protein
MAYQSEIEKLEQRYHENPQQWFAALADSYRKAGDLELALEVVRGGLEKRPNYSSGHIVLGRCLVDQGQYIEAAGAFEQVLELDAENIIALKSLGDIAEKQGDLAGAKAWLTKLLDIDPMNEEASEGIERIREAERAAPPESEPAAEETTAAAIEPGAAWAAEALANMDRGDAPADSSSADTRSGDETPVEVAPVQPEVLEPPPSEPGSEVSADQDFAVERSSWDDVHGAAALGLSDDGAAGLGDSLETDADATPGVPLAPEPVAGFEATAESSAQAEPTGPVDHNPDEAAEPTREEASGQPEGGSRRMAGDLEVLSFDEELSWDAGEPQSTAITEDDVREADAHHEDLAAPVEFLGDPQAYAARGEAEPASRPESSGAPVTDEAFEGEPEPSGVVDEAESEEAVQAAAPVGSEDTSPEWEPPSAEEQVAFERASAAEEPADLPLIMPDEAGAAPEPSTVEGAEMEPVVTETMAEVYARQGLYEQARETYGRLLQQRPGDPVLEEKLALLSQRMGSQRTPASSRFSAAATGGVSAVDYLKGIFQPATAPAAWSAEPPPAEPAASESSESTVLESAFGAEPDEPPGSPTIPASDEVSLSSVFGGEPASHQQQRQAPGEQFLEQAGSVSFDEFYGTATEPEQDGAEEEPESGGEEGDDDFRNWLEGLKT